MGKVLGIVYRAIATHLRRKAGFTRATAQTGAITVIQRFGGVKFNIHFHMLFLDGVYIGVDKSRARFHWHDLRHTWASRHVQSGTSLAELQELGGWSCHEMVLSYAHLGGEHLKRVAGALQTQIGHNKLDANRCYWL